MTRPAEPDAPADSVDRREVARFAQLAERWWDAEGPLEPLHRLNPIRLAYIRDRLAGHFGREPLTPPGSLKPLDGIRLLDIGCGGGLVAEPMARLGAAVVAIDAAAENVAVARAHAEAAGLAIDYRAASAEAVAAAGERFDTVLALEIIEHVADRDSFLATAAGLVAPGGALVAATLNRTPKSYLLAIVGAEYLLGWLPRGTHDWRKFVRPSELARALRRAGLELADVSGTVYRPLTGEWRIARDTDVNYMAFATRPGKGGGRRPISQ